MSNKNCFSYKVNSNIKNLIVSALLSNFSGHGFGIGPAAGQLSADLATSATPIVNPTDFRYDRLIDGSPMTPTTTP